MEDHWWQYNAGGRKHEDFLDREELDEARRSDATLEAEVSAFYLISTMQDAYDMAYWIQANRSIRKGALLLAEFLVNSPLDHGRPASAQLGR